MAQTPFDASSVEEYFGYRSHFLTTGSGDRIHYLDEGEGAPVIMIHGSAVGITAAVNFYLNIPVLAKHGYRVLAPDLFGYGWTEPAPDTTPSLETWMDEIIQFMEALNIDKAYLIGNSLGGYISVRLAMAFPDRFLGNIVIGTGGAVWPTARPSGPMTSREHHTAFDREFVTRAVHFFLDNPDMAPERMIDYRTAMATLPGAAERHGWVTRLRNQSVAEPFDVEAANACPVPTLIIYGRNDRLGPPENALALAEALPNADLVVLAHCGHWSQIERVDEFNTLMLNFLNGHAQRLMAPPIRSLDLHGGDLVD